MAEQQSQETTQPPTNAERFAGFVGLTARLEVDAISRFRDAIEDSDTKAVEVQVAGVDIGEDGKPSAFRVRHSEILRHIIENGGDPDSAEARGFGLYPDRQANFTVDGTRLLMPGQNPNRPALAKSDEGFLNVRPGPFKM